MRARVLLSTLLLAALGSEVAAQPKDKGEGYEQSGAPLEFGCEVIPAANTAKPIQHRHVTVRDACFPWGTLISWKADGGKANVAYTMTASVSFEAGVDTSRGHNLVDANGLDGPAAGFVLSNGETKDAVMGQLQTFRQPGARPGICTTGVLGPGRELVFPPCRVTADCTALGAGTCTTSPTASQKQRSCGFVVVQVSAASTRVCWRVDE